MFWQNTPLWDWRIWFCSVESVFYYATVHLVLNINLVVLYISTPLFLNIWNMSVSFSVFTHSEGVNALPRESKCCTGYCLTLSLGGDAKRAACELAQGIHLLRFPPISASLHLNLLLNLAWISWKRQSFYLRTQHPTSPQTSGVLCLIRWYESHARGL